MSPLSESVGGPAMQVTCQPSTSVEASIQRLFRIHVFDYYSVLQADHYRF